MLTLGLLVDAAAEVPQSVLDNRHVSLLPLTVIVDDGTLLDCRAPADSRMFNTRHLNVRTAISARSMPPSKEEVKHFLLEKVAAEFDHVFGLFGSSTRSPLFKNAFEASSQAISESIAVRTAAGLRGPLFVECYDSLNLFSGYGVQVQAALRHMETQPPVAAVRGQMEQLSHLAYSYVAPGDLDFVLHRAKTTGEASLGLLGHAAAKVLGTLPVLQFVNGQARAVAKLRGVDAARNHVLQLAHRELQRGLVAPFMTLSYSGDVHQVLAWPGYRDLAQDAAAQGVQLSVVEMAPTNSINLGPHALAVGFFARPHEPLL